MTTEKSDPSPRLTPYELVFGAEAIDDRLFPPIAEEAEARDMSLDDPDRFLFLSSVGRLLQSVAGGGERVGEGQAESQGEGRAEGRNEEIRQYGRLLYQAFHLWEARKPLLLLTVNATRWLVDDVTTVGDWRLRPPAPSGYVQLPRQLFWAAPARGMTPEPVDGFFWTFVPGGDDSPDTLHVLLALGLRPDRPGFSIVPATGRLDTVDHWAEIDGRPDGTDFETTLPGGEQDRLYSLETPAEILKLASRVFWHVDASPESLSSERKVDQDRAGSAEDVGFQARAAEAGPDAGPDASGPAHGMPPSALPYRTVGGRG